MNGTRREQMQPGSQVFIVLKRDQQSGKLTEGIVKDILTKSPVHRHGIKVRLESGEIGRVKHIIQGHIMALNHWPESETAFKAWLGENALEVLQDIGIREAQTVLDYGCNSGAFTLPAARIVGHKGKVYALDTNSKALDVLREKADNEALTNIDVLIVHDKQDPLSTLTEKADAILLYDVLQLIDDKSALLMKLHTMLQPDGFLSVFPMHIGVEQTLQIATQRGLFALRDQRGMLLNFHAGSPPDADQSSLVDRRGI